ncbi:hypothetical protein [Staphylococcus devriesei]|uniref:Lipoprotein n=2 Tax=Staphylococcus devriesei TaxID=586733 RepID=A0A2T4KEX8_9STAP|nr:hypothetical protein [Staphylococcus devriesei]PTE70424.1 hypothetical protein BUY44_11020 [Staphylococcus devriesei]WKU13723.1 hypothetical protein Q2T90_01780 [Staphylococcus devriesei]
MKRYINILSIIIICFIICAGCSNNENEKNNKPEKVAIAQNKSNGNQVSKSQFTKKDKHEIKSKVLAWLSDRSKKRGTAVSSRYFSTSSISKGDWYAMTLKGEIQVFNANKPGRKAFDLHGITGATVYTAKDGKTGYDYDAKTLSNVEGYDKVANLSKPITKYIFTEEGKVFEYQFENKNDVTLSSGFAPKDYNDKDPNLLPNEQFKETDNKELKKYYKQVIEKYK